MSDTPQNTSGLITVSTASVNPRDAIEYWVDLVCRHLIEVECDHPAGSNQFHGEIRLRRVGKLDISQISAAEQKVARTARLMAQAGQEHFLLNIQRAGISALRQDGREATLKPGDMALYSSARRYDLEFNENFRQTVLIFDADTLRALVPGIDTLTATALHRENPAAKLLSLMADGYFQTEFSTLPEIAGARASDALIEIFAEIIGEFCPKVRGRATNLAQFHLTRIKRYAIDNLQDPDLSVGRVSQALHISPAHIHRQFEAEMQTFAEWMWSQRLLTCKQALRNNVHAHLPVSEIAYNAGFSNPSHFSRTFRMKFGMTPREWRSIKSME